jgi:hypothetical protein
MRASTNRLMLCGSALLSQNSANTCRCGSDRVALLAAPLFGFRCFWRSRHPDDVTTSGDATYWNNVRLRTMFQGTQDVVRDHRPRMRVRHSSPPLPLRDTGLSTFRGYLCIPRECQVH